MDVEQYYNMCDMMGVEPNPDDLPPSLSELPLEVQLAYDIYQVLPVRIAEFSGVYLGKDYGLLGFFLDMYEVTDSSWRKFYFKIIRMLDSIVIDRNQKEKAKEKTK